MPAISPKKTWEGTIAGVLGSAGVAAVDYDDDGDVDLYVAGDSSQNCLYQNQGNGTFVEAGEDFAELAQLLSDGPTAPVGGDLGWAEAGTYVPEFEQVVGNMKVGDISEPFRSPFGWHIIELLERRVYDNTEDLKESNCVQRVRNGKMNSETELWARRIRDEAFVETRI